MPRSHPQVTAGLTVNNVDQVLAPYAEKTYNKYVKDAEEFLDKSVTSVASYAEMKTRKAVYDAMQAIEYEINTLHTANGQTPFTTLSFGLGTNIFERMIQGKYFRCTYQGYWCRGGHSSFP